MLDRFWNKTGLTAKIALLFSVSLLLVVVMAVAMIFSFNRVDRSVDFSTQAQDELETLYGWERSVLRLNDGINRYLASRDEAVRDEVEGIGSASLELVDRALLLVEDPERRAMTQALREEEERLLQSFNRQVQLLEQSANIMENHVNVLHEQVGQGIEQVTNSERLAGAINTALEVTGQSSQMARARQRVFNFVVSGDPDYAREAIQMMQAVQDYFRSVAVDHYEMVDFDDSLADPVKEEAFESVINGIEGKVNYLGQMIDLQIETDRILNDEILLAQRDIVEGLAALIAEIDASVDQANADLVALVNFSRVLALIVGLSGIAFCFVAGWLFSRWLRKTLTTVASQLRTASIETDAASAQIASSSQELASGANQQASSLEETSSSMEEMASMVERNAANAMEAKKLSNIAREAADRGYQDMEEMSRSMNSIIQSSKEISKIIKTIDEIAFQTNILALNAAVEAARAGEAGAGFAVVADEVRNLAQRSADAARETAERLGSAAEQSEQGAKVSEKVGISLREIVERVQEVDKLVEEIAGANTEQSQGIKQINAAIVQMDQVTQSNAAGAEETASASASLRDQSTDLKRAVDALIELVNGDSDDDEVLEETEEPVSKESASPKAKRGAGSNGSKPESRSSVHATNGKGAKSSNNGQKKVSASKTDRKEAHRSVNEVDVDEETRIEEFFR
ncbi:MAG: hypothetical protein JJU20_06525 [Opitutales bacterium]|nr:hypothetical protein [Opitutales bacterium]